jgi:hypothetical protein
MNNSRYFSKTNPIRSPRSEYIFFEWTISAYRRDARFHPAERMKHKRKVRSKGKGREGGSDGRYQP